MDRRINRPLLANALLGSFLGGVAVRIFMVAMPTVASDLKTDVVGVSWGVAGFMLSSVGFSLVSGRIADIYGRSRVYGAGYVITMIASLLCGLATSITQLVIFRILQGLGGAMILSVGRAIAADAVPEEAGGKAQGLMSAAHHSGFLLGPSIGGFIIEYMGWRWTFFCLIPLAAVGLFQILGDKGPPPAPKARTSIDYLGTVLLVVSSSALILLLDQRATLLLGQGAKAALALLLAGSFLWFVFREGKVPSPILDLSMFKIRMFTLSAISLFLVGICYSVNGLIFPFYLQDILHLSPSMMGLLFMISPIFTIAFSPLSGHLSDRVGSVVPATTGAALLTVSLFLGIILKTDTHWVLPSMIFVVMGLANGFFNPANSHGMIYSVPKEQLGVASGAYSVTMSLGNILGISLTNFLMTIAFQRHSGISDAVLTPDNPTAFIAALNFTFLVAAGVSLVAVVTSAIKGKSR